ncbi:MAG: iron-siderophore ABC transporter substrate-binding protein, partial [Stackebrandtia sp.]
MSTVPRIPRRLARSAAAMVAVIVAASALSSCSLLSQDSGGDDSGSGAFPVTIKHALGEATVKEKPKRIVTVGWLSQDVVAALGTVPVGVGDFTWGNVDKYLPWFEDRVNELDGDLPEIVKVNDADEASAEQI